MDVDFQTLVEWGSNFKRETDLGVRIAIETPIFETAYNREFGSAFSINTPKKNTDLEIFVPLTIIEALQVYSENERLERKAVVDIENIFLEDSKDESVSESDGFIKYFRVVDLIEKGVVL